MVRAAAVVPVVWLIAAGLAGCEYADDGRPSPSASARTGGSLATDPVAVASVDPELMADLDRNMAALEKAMVEIPIGLGGGAGAIGGRGGGGGRLEFTARVTKATTYKVTAACIGARGARLSVGSASGKTLLEFTAPCAEILNRDVELRPGPVTVRLVAVGDGHLQAASGVVRINEAAGFPLTQP